MKNLKKMLRTLESIKRECENLKEDEIEKVISQNSEEAVEALREILSVLSLIFRILSPFREKVISKRIKIQEQIEEKDPP